MTHPHLTLITGGSRSGKSAYALAMAHQWRPDCAGVYFLATAEPIDDEMRARIGHHRAARPASITTLEEPLNVVAAVRDLPDRVRVLIVDCLTIWVSNLLAAERSDEQISTEARALARVLCDAPFASLVVSDEVGAGIVPMDPLGRRFRDLLGWTNQTLARAADRLLLMVAGYPLQIK